jgi:NAD-dependent DNA ligase
MLGLAKGVLTDGMVDETEAGLLRDWVRAHPDVAGAWPGKVLAKRFFRIFEDGQVDTEEQEDLAGLLQELVGGEAGLIGGEQAVSELPFDRPQPEIEFIHHFFVFTGRFAFGPRAECEKEVRRLGGWVEKGITKGTDYLVVGTFGSRDWAQSSFGRKIEKAVAYREAGEPIRIVTEDHWAAAFL